MTLIDVFDDAMTDRQWAAAYVLDNSPIAFDPLAEARRALHVAHQSITTPGVIAAFSLLVHELDQLPTIREQRDLLDRIAGGTA